MYMMSCNEDRVLESRPMGAQRRYSWSTKIPFILRETRRDRSYPPCLARVSETSQLMCFMNLNAGFQNLRLAISNAMGALHQPSEATQVELERQLVRSLELGSLVLGLVGRAPEDRLLVHQALIHRVGRQTVYQLVDQGD